MTLSRERVAAVKDERSAEEVAMIAAHEGAHGEAVPLRGELLPAFAGQTRREVHLLLQEGFAEVKANEAMGRSVDAHREGQPQEVYGEGQELILRLIRRTSRQEVERLMTGHGDLEKFQREAALAASSSLAWQNGSHRDARPAHLLHLPLRPAEEFRSIP